MESTVNQGIACLVRMAAIPKQKSYLIGKGGGSMNLGEHRIRHQELHKVLDELFADFIGHGDGRTGSTIMDLIVWSFKQTENPDHAANS